MTHGSSAVSLSTYRIWYTITNDDTQYACTVQALSAWGAQDAFYSHLQEYTPSDIHVSKVERVGGAL